MTDGNGHLLGNPWIKMFARQVLYYTFSFSNHNLLLKLEMKWSISKHVTKREREKQEGHAVKIIGSCNLRNNSLVQLYPALFSLWCPLLSDTQNLVMHYIVFANGP